MKNKIPNNYLLILAIVTGFNLLALAIRNMVQGNTIYNFLLWNLFLAFVPLLVAWLLQFFVSKLSKVLIVIGSFVWLLFYPNAPYMISDLIHVNSASNIVLYETLIIFSFSMLALFYGFFSLKIIHVIYKQLFSEKIAHTVVIASILLSSFGIYLGRILRLNSWNLFTHPLQVMKTIFHHLFPIGQNPSTYIIILLFSIIQFILLVMMKDMDEVGGKRLISGEYEI